MSVCAGGSGGGVGDRTIESQTTTLGRDPSKVGRIHSDSLMGTRGRLCSVQSRAGQFLTTEFGKQCLSVCT